MFNIVTIGGATRDVFIGSRGIMLVPSDKFATGVGECVALGSKVEADYIHFDTGGGATNSAVTFSRMGLKSGIITRIGEDSSGRDVLKVLKNENISTRLVQKTDKEHTGYSVLLLTERGERAAIAYRGASSKILKNEIDWRAVKTEGYYITSLGGDLTLVREILASSKPCLRAFTHRQAGLVAWNPGSAELKLGLPKLSPLIKQTAVLLVNREEAAMLTGVALGNTSGLLKKLSSLGGIFAIMTDSRLGAYATAKGEVYHAGALDVPVVNTTGAGDAFGSGLVATLLRGKKLTEALQVATLNAHGVIGKMGAKTGILKSYPSERERSKIKITKL